MVLEVIIFPKQILPDEIFLKGYVFQSREMYALQGLIGAYNKLLENDV